MNLLDRPLPAACLVPVLLAGAALMATLNVLYRLARFIFEPDMMRRKG